MDRVLVRKVMLLHTTGRRVASTEGTRLMIEKGEVEEEKAI
jgi:hypothetical protein